MSEFDASLFYDLMQSYRHAPIYQQRAVTEAYDAVLDFIADLLLTLSTESVTEAKYREALLSMIGEARLHLGMYVRAYKCEPYDTGVLVDLYIREAADKIKRAEAALGELAKKTENLNETHNHNDKELQMDPLHGLAIGRIVHYHRYGSPGGEHKPEPSPAVVTQIFENGECQLFVMNPNGLYFNRTPHSIEPKPGHWNWPPR